MNAKPTILFALLLLPFTLLAQDVNWYKGTWVSSSSRNIFQKVEISTGSQAGQLKAVFHDICPGQKHPCNIISKQVKVVKKADGVVLTTKFVIAKSNKGYRMTIMPRGNSGLLMIETQIVNTQTQEKSNKTLTFSRKSKSVVPTPKEFVITGEKIELPDNSPGPKPRPSTSVKKGKSNSKTGSIPSKNPRPNYSKPSKVILPNCKDCHLYRVYLSGGKTKEVIKPVLDSQKRGVAKIPALPPGTYRVQVIWAGKMDMPGNPPYESRSLKAVSGRSTTLTLNNK
ncbi:MAG: hypothetical protein AAFY71_16230 [Bacteroidota bacterium]